MSEPAKSQWNFGELFPTEQTRKVLTVAELTGQIRRLLEKQLAQLWVSGEVSNLRLQASGHIYFTLKDASAQVMCVLFRNTPGVERSLLADGQKVLLQGDISVYEPRGQYQLVVRSVEQQGLGALQVKFEKLKQKLAAEGLFAPERKRPLPRFAQRIGIVSSPTGAAIRDVLNVIRRRHCALDIIFAPCRVQGDCSAAEIAGAIRRLNQFHASQRPECRLDVILVTRGGGSLEDLWAFNEEAVARAIFDSEVPVVSAVGHEIDFTISDFVADVRAATPSVGAELITEGVFASREFVVEALSLFQRALRRGSAVANQKFSDLRGRLRRLHPRRRLQDELQRMDELQNSLVRCLKAAGRERSNRFRHVVARLARLHPVQTVTRRQELLRHIERRLNAVGPEQVLGRGYSITMDAATGRVVHAAADVKAAQLLRTRLKHGEVLSRAEKAPNKTRT